MISRFLLIFGFLLLISPINTFAGKMPPPAPMVKPGTGIPQDDVDPPQLSAYYDQRDRSSYVQVTNTTENTVRIHVQIFQHDRNCNQLNFFDDLTANDTVIYDLDNLKKNNGSEVPANIAENSYGYVVVSDVAIEASSTLIGNFRIIDHLGDYEYRTNMAGVGINSDPSPLVILNSSDKFIANFNTANGSNQADVVGYAYDGADRSSVTNYGDGVSFNIFVFDMNEEPLSCDQKVFACGGVMNYGINEDYPNSRESDVICPGGGLANEFGGFISFENPAFVNRTVPSLEVFVGLIGLNNGNGTGSMDYWLFVDSIFVDVQG